MRWAAMRTAVVVAATSVAASVAVGAIYMRVETTRVPVTRLAENIERQLKEKPDDVGLRLNLARLYAMAYALKVTEFDSRSKEGENLEAWFGYEPPTLPGPVKAAHTPEHQERAKADLSRALALYEDVIKRAPDNHIAHLGYAWTLEQAHRKAEATNEYRKVVELAWPIDAKRKFIMHGQEPATTEAALRLSALLDPTRDAAELAALKEKIAELAKRGRAITPIAISMRDGHVDVPADPAARVRFDADGSGVPRDWTWIQRDAGWLVYDADGKGEITSALQWFGSVTFWLFWENGYHALGALDDDGDGELRGNELRNLAIWRDKNQNGASENGEVRPLAAHGIAALSCAYEPGDGIDIAAHSPRGVTLGDGTTRPSFDVILRTNSRSITLTTPLQ
jgi:hypothetical protein